MRRIHWLASWLPFFLAMLVGVAEAQTAGDIRLQIRLRNSDGTAVAGETIILERLPDEEPIAPECATNANGECAWLVRRGLYQALFARPLDNISALAVAEGGLRGFGVTVGDNPITYHFTVHSDGRVYFDAAPEAAVPSPIIPVGETLHGSDTNTPAQPAEDAQIDAEMPTPEPASPPDTAVNPPVVSPPFGSAWRFLLFISSGLAIGGGLHLFRRRSGQVWSRKRRGPKRKSEDADA